MSDEAGTALVRDAAGAAAACAAARRLGAIHEFSPDEMDDLDQAVRRSEMRQVVVASVEVLLDGVWSGDIDWPAWRAAGATVIVADGSDSAALLDPVAARYAIWRGRRRRQNAIAGLLVGIVALAAGFLANLWLATG